MRGEGRIREIHRSEDLRVTKTASDLVKQTRLQGFAGKEFVGILLANMRAFEIVFLEVN